LYDFIQINDDEDKEDDFNDARKKKNNS